jgi:drug/metabolite transporter (DMT)-like permease
VAMRFRSSGKEGHGYRAAVVQSLLLGVTVVGLPYALGVWAAGQVAPGDVATIYAAMPLVTLLIGGQGSGAEIPALVVGIGGVALLVAQGLSTSTIQIKGGALLAASVALQAWSFGYAKRRLKRGNLLASAAIQLAAAAVLVGILSVATERMTMDVNRQSVASLLALAIVVSGTTLPLLYWLLMQMGAWRVAALQWMATLVAVVEGVCFLRARPSVEMWLGAAVVVITTTWLLMRGRFRGSETVTLQITNEPISGPNASLSKVD